MIHIPSYHGRRRKTISFLMVARITNIGPDTFRHVVQHTDAVSGTVKQRVADDYVRILHKGVEECQKIQNSFYQ